MYHKNIILHKKRRISSSYKHSQSAGKIGLYLPTIISIYLNDGISITPPVVDDVLPDSGTRVVLVFFFVDS